VVRAQGQQLSEITSLIESGVIRSVVDKVLPFEMTAEALAYVEAGRARGKVVIAVKGWRRPVIDHVIPFEQAKEALAYLGKGAKRKVGVQMGNGAGTTRTIYTGSAANLPDRTTHPSKQHDSIQPRPPTFRTGRCTHCRRRPEHQLKLR